MTPQQIFATALRLFALWLLVTSFKFLVWTPQALIHYSEGRGFDMSIGTGIGMLVVAAVLWFFPLWIAHKFVPRTHFDNHVNLQPLEAARVGSALIGLWFFANGLLSLAWNVLTILISNSAESGISDLPADERIRFMYTLIELTLALLLMLRGGTVARLVVRGQKA